VTGQLHDWAPAKLPDDPPSLPRPDDDGIGVVMLHAGHAALIARAVADCDVVAVTAAMMGPTGLEPFRAEFPDRTYVANRDDRQYRRGLYTHWQRMFPHPMMANFDAPSREECTANRVQANTPQQALTLLNDPSFVEAARVFAVKLLAQKQSEDDRLDRAFQVARQRRGLAAGEVDAAVLLGQPATPREQVAGAALHNCLSSFGF